MAKLRVFVSSTCYDLNILRSEVRPFILSLGYEPIMSEYSDILYDPRQHTHDSCLKEIPSADVVVLIIGSRFGGSAVPTSLSYVDFSRLQKLSTKTGILENSEKLSITQLEVLKAIQASIPVYAFVEESVYHDHHVYEKNKAKKDVIDQIEFPSIQKSETAKYIFEFINFLSHRNANNGVYSFSKLEDIKSTLTSQWSQLLQRLLSESRSKAHEERRYRDFAEQIEDLKAVVLASLATPDLREAAKGALQFRRMIGFISNFQFVDHRKLLLSDLDWDGLLDSAGVKEIKRYESSDRPMRTESVIILRDGTFYRCRLPIRIIEEYRIDWNAFSILEDDSRAAIVDALLEDREMRRFGLPVLQHIPEQYEEYSARKSMDSQAETDETDTESAPIVGHEPTK